MAVATEQNALYRTFWRWHFYAALFVIPLVLLLSVTGSAYLFKPQLDRLQQSMLVEQARSELVPAGTLDPELQLSKVMSAYPGWQFQYYQLPEQVGDHEYA